MAGDEAKTWYDDGLQFTCTQCGNCCTGASGFVWFNDTELEAMAEHLDITTEEFMLGYARQLNTRKSLKEIKRGRKYDCVFLATDPKTGKSGCSIYPVRPTQCRSWPFWSDTVESLRSYATVARDCPGVAAGLEGKGEHHTYTQIRVRVNQTPY
jgi:Fe-S-cluster containining protein